MYVPMYRRTIQPAREELEHVSRVYNLLEGVSFITYVSREISKTYKRVVNVFNPFPLCISTEDLQC